MNLDANAPSLKPPSPRLGFTAASYGIRLRTDHPAQFRDTLDFLEHAHRVGAGGLQVPIGDWSPDFIRRLRSRAEETGMYLEGQVALPRNENESAGFERRIRAAREAGARIVRTVALSGRRYETFNSAEAFRQFVDRSWRSLRLAEPIARRHGIALAVENHKDWRVPGLLKIVETFGSEFLGICVDFGNSISLLEEPLAVIRAYAPYALTTHCKDMAAAVMEEGFLLSEVPLGKGSLDLKTCVEILRGANPRIAFNLEMITRDPLRVPCLASSYWATFPELPASTLAATLGWVRRHPPAHPLPTVSGKSAEARLALEERHNLESLDYAREVLGFA